MTDGPWRTMGGPLTASFYTHPCPCRIEHAPSVPWTHGHHIHPLYAGGPDVVSNIVYICPATHDWVHVILRWFEKNGFRSRRTDWPHYAYELAVLGWKAMQAA